MNEDEHLSCTQKSVIAALARQYWEEEGQPEGKAEAHWLRAEAEVRRSEQPQPETEV